MPHQHQSYGAIYRWRVFWPVFLVLVLVTIISQAGIYYFRSREIFRDTQTTLKTIATEVASQIPVAIHEGLTMPQQQSSPEYQSIESSLQAVMRGNPDIFDIYTLRRTADPELLMFVVSARESQDDDGNGEIDVQEEKVNLGEQYEVAQAPRLLDAFNGPAADDEVTYDKWGAWVSGYAPVREKNGNAVAVVGVDFLAGTISAQRSELLRSLALTDLIIILPLVIIASYLLSLRLSRPFRHLAEGMDQVAHGNLHFRLPHAGNSEEEIFGQLFNNMLDLYDSSKRSRPSSDEPPAPG